jgi:hypothetical protein
MLAIVDLLCAGRDRVVANALSVATLLHADLSLLSVVPRHAYERGVRYEWPENAFGRMRPAVDIHRVVVPGSPEEALLRYADRIQADILVVPGEYKVRRWLRTRSLALSAAVLTSRSIWIMPSDPGVWTAGAPVRAGCVLRLDGTDDRLCMAAQSIVHRCGGELVLSYATGFGPGGPRRTSATMDRTAALHAMERLGRSLLVPWSALVLDDCSEAALSTVAVQNSFSLIVAGRSVHVKRDADSGNLVFGGTLPCPVLSVQLLSAPAATCLTAREKTTSA